MAFEGDGIVIPSDVELTHKKANTFVKDAIAKAGSGLSEELADIGYCEIGYIVMTQGYSLPAKKLIFMPYMDRDDNLRKMDYLQLHQAIRSSLSLASLYGLRTLAIPVIRNLLSKRENLVGRVVSKVFDTKDGDQTSEAESIIEGISKGFESESLKEVFLFLWTTCFAYEKPTTKTT